MKLLLQRVGKEYVYVCPFRSSERAAILKVLDVGSYVVVNITEDITNINSTSEFLHNLPMANFDGDCHRSYREEIKQIVPNSSREIDDKIEKQNLIERINQDKDPENRFLMIKNMLGVALSDDDLVKSKTAGLYFGPNGNKSCGRLVDIKINGISCQYLLHTDLTLGLWELEEGVWELEEKRSSTDFLNAHKTNIDLQTSNKNISIEKKSTISIEKSKTDLDAQARILAQLKILEKSGKITHKHKIPKVVKVRSPEVEEEFDEDKAFSDLELDLSLLESTENGLESMELIDEKPSSSESGDGQDSQINTKDSDSDNSVVLEDDHTTLTIRYEGSIYRKKFKSPEVAKRQSENIVEMMSDPGPGIIEMLNGPASIFTRVS